MSKKIYRGAAIIPCSGFGTRMNMKKNKSKEMLIDPHTGQPLIQWHLDLCKKYNLKPVIITRPEKKDLIAYLKKKRITPIFEKKPKDWMTSVMATSHKWHQHNILFLPDSRFGDTKQIESALLNLEMGISFCFGTHDIPDGEQEKWGILQPNTVYEKLQSTSTKAWGFIAFEDMCGSGLFNCLERNKFYNVYTKPSYVHLEWFKDITRTGKIEPYL